MVSKASDDLPEPDSPVNTMSLSRGSSNETLRRLCSRAPRITSLSDTPREYAGSGRSEHENLPAVVAGRGLPGYRRGQEGHVGVALCDEGEAGDAGGVEPADQGGQVGRPGEQPALVVERGPGQTGDQGPGGDQHGPAGSGRPVAGGAQPFRAPGG